MADITREELNKLINDAMNEINEEKDEATDEVIDTDVNTDVPADDVKPDEEVSDKEATDDVVTDEPKEETAPETSNKEPIEFLGATITINEDGTKATITKDDMTKEVDIASTDLKDVFSSVETFFEDFVQETSMGDGVTEETTGDVSEDTLDNVPLDDVEDSVDDTDEDKDLKELEDKLNSDDLLDDEDDEEDHVTASKILASSMDELYKRYGNKVEELVELALETKNAVLSSVSELTQKKPISVLSSKINELKTEKDRNSKKEVNVTKKYLLAKKVNKNVHSALDTIVASLKTINNNSDSFSDTQMGTEIKNIKILAEQFINSKTPETILASCVSIENNNKSLNTKLDEFKKQKEAVIAKRIEKNKVNNVVSSNKIVHKNLERSVLSDRYDGMEEMFNELKRLASM